LLATDATRWRGDRARTRSRSAMTIRPDLIALRIAGHGLAACGVT
jgi:hypothetical protein